MADGQMTDDRQVTVIARVRAKEGMEERLKAELLSLVAPSRSEDGCINYDLHQLIDDRTCFMFHENWESRAALEAHLEMPHSVAFDGRVEGMLAGEFDITVWERIS